MAQIEAIVAGTHVIPSFGRSLLSEADLQSLATQLRQTNVPMLREHDIDQPIEVRVVNAEVRPTTDGEHHLHVVYEVPDDEVDAIVATGGMSIGFTRLLFGPDDPDAADSVIAVDPRAYNLHELIVTAERLNEAGFTPQAAVYFQLSDLSPATVVFQFLNELPVQVGWAVVTGAILAGLRVLIRPDRKTRYRFVIDRDKDRVVAEIETSSERALREALKALVELDDQNGGMFVRDQKAKQWRRAGTGRQRRKATRARK